MIKPKVAILIPTMNRSDFLIRQVRYYASVKSPHPVYIGDASDAEHKERTRAAIKDLQSQINIHYHHWQDLNAMKTIKRLIEVAEEPYCSCIGDDDFLVPNSLTKCAQFLEQNPEYSTAQGKGILFSLNEVGPYGAMGSLGTYWSRNEVEENTGEQRLINFFPKNYFVNQFSVHRTDDFVQDSEFYKGIDDSSFGELLHCNLAIIRGKSKFIDSFYLIRQVHPEQHIGLYLNWKNDAFDWLTHLDWQPSFQVYQKTLTRSLSEVDGIGEDEAYEIVKQTLWSYLAVGLPKKYRKKYGQTSSSRQNATVNGKIHGHEPLRELVKKIPGTRRVATLLRNARASIFSEYVDITEKASLAIRAEKGELSLQALLHPSSPYHMDFIPVYNAIVQASEKKEVFS